MGYQIDITTRPVVKNRSINMHELPYGSLPYAAPLTPDKNDQESTVRALRKRLCRPLPWADEGGIYKFVSVNPNLPDYSGLSAEGEKAMERLAAFTDRFCKRYLRPLDELPTTAQWIDELNHPAWRKDQLHKIREEVGGYEFGWVPTQKQRSSVDMFIKLEDYPEYKEARAINSRSDYFKVFSGPAFSAIEREVYKLPWFAKHLTPEQKIERIKELRGKCFATDFTAFESHMTPTVMAALECRVYEYCLRKWPGLAATICTTLMGRNCLKTRTGVKATVWGRRMSGDMCTSLGNGLTNIILALFIAEEKTGSHTNLDGLVEGDDGLFTLSGADLTKEDYRRLGFTIKIETHDSAQEAGFCQMFFSSADQYVKDPVKVLANFGWSSSCVGAGNRVRLELLRAKALSLVFCLPHCPVVRALADRALYVTRGCAARFVYDGYHQLPRDEGHVPPSRIAPETRTLFAKLYGISPAEQISLENRIALGHELGEVMEQLWLKNPHFRQSEEMRTLRYNEG